MDRIKFLKWITILNYFLYIICILISAAALCMKIDIVSMLNIGADVSDVLLIGMLSNLAGLILFAAGLIMLAVLFVKKQRRSCGTSGHFSGSLNKCLILTTANMFHIVLFFTVTLFLAAGVFGFLLPAQ